MPIKSVSKQLTISLVSYNTRGLLRRSLASIYRFTKNVNFEVIVVDNASTDGSAAMVKKSFPKVKLIVNPENRFYTGAINQALAISQGEFFLILNSDIFLTDNALLKMLAYLQRHPKVGAVEPVQVYENGMVVQTGSRHNSLGLDLVELTWLHRLVKPKKLAVFRLRDRDRRRTWPAPVICDAVIMLPMATFKTIHGYDESFKLYYTENDLCRRLQHRGLKTVHYGSASVRHTVSASTTKVGWNKISAIYARDALAYYRKYHSLEAGWFIFFALKLNNLLISLKQHWQLTGIMLLAAMLRFYSLSESMIFGSYQGRDYLAARDMVLTGKWPLLGIETTMDWLRQGPYFVWLIALAFKLSNFNPAAPAVLTAILGTLTVYLFYRYSRSFLGTLFLATSPLAVMHSRMPYHISPLPLLMVIYLMCLRKKSVFLAFLLAGFLFQFELNTFPVLLFTGIYLWPKRRYFLTQSWSYFLPLLPRIIYDMGHSWQQTRDFLSYVVFRIAFIFGLNNYRGVTVESLQYVSKALVNIWVKFFSWGHPGLALILTAGLLVSTYRYKQWWFFLGLNIVSFYFNGYITQSYFPILFPVLAILVAVNKNKWWQGLIGISCLINVFTLVSHKLYFPVYGPSLAEQIEKIKLNQVEIKSQDYHYQYLFWYYQSKYGF